MRERPAGRRSTRLGPFLAGLVLAGCGAASRATLTQFEFVEVHSDPAALAGLRGREPRLSFLWTESARLAAIESPDAALDLVRAGLAHHPGDVALVLSEIEVLEQLARPAEALACAEAALAAPLPHGIRVALHHARLRQHLALGDLDLAQLDCQHIGGVLGGPPEAAADAWARLALARMEAGQQDDAHAALARSLDRGTVGLGVLAALADSRPEARAAVAVLLSRGLARQPLHPDLQLMAAVSRMSAGAHAEAEAALASLPEPLPERLLSDVAALRARVVILQGRVDEGLASLFRRLDESPSDRAALAVLEETFATLGQPTVEQFVERLERARPGLEPRERAQLDAAVQRLLSPGARPEAPPPAR